MYIRYLQLPPEKPRKDNKVPTTHRNRAERALIFQLQSEYFTFCIDLNHYSRVKERIDLKALPLLGPIRGILTFVYRVMNKSVQEQSAA